MFRNDPPVRLLLSRVATFTDRQAHEFYLERSIAWLLHQITQQTVGVRQFSPREVDSPVLELSNRNRSIYITLLGL